MDSDLRPIMDELTAEMAKRGFSRVLTPEETACVAALIRDLRLRNDDEALVYRFLKDCNDAPQTDIIAHLSNHWFRSEFFSVPDRF